MTEPTTESDADYIVIVTGDDNASWYWRAVANGNNENVALGGEPFISRDNAVAAAQAAFPNIPNELVFDDNSTELAIYRSQVFNDNRRTEEDGARQDS